ncbi:tRNA-dependent cyclodipeptide synthase [Coleofasciculus sp. G2-EDA-02]|uniref:tRNA-dependent cyclodipeptide synthase n=1 Tax=Coleofasciculus sp. G2-EDA-02 TaxID=3069529 RepID=UPI0032F9162C
MTDFTRILYYAPIMTDNSVSDLEELFPQSIKLLPENRYRAKVDAVVPFSARASFEQLESCFLGISLENKNFTPEKLRALIEWISKRFLHCIVLVGDSIHRITLEITRGLEPKIAFGKALDIGNSFIQENEHIFNAFCGQTKFNFETCHQIQASDEYNQLHQYLQNYFETNGKFRSSVESFGRKYNERRLINCSRSELEYYISRSCDYFLEEFAIFTCLQRRGFSVMVYPGSFSTLTEIANGEYADIIEELKQLIVVSIHFKGR